MLIVCWGGTQGYILTAVEQWNSDGRPVAFAHFNYRNPLPANTKEILDSYEKVIVAELNDGQFADYLQAKFPEVKIERINKVQGQPFLVSEIVDEVTKMLED